MSKKKVNFQLAAEIAGDATGAILLGDFNNWNTETGSVLKKQKDGSFKAAIELEAGKKYEYRYLLNDGRWVNDSNADAYSFDPFFQVDNCVVEVPAVKKAPAKAKATAAPKATAAAKPAKAKAAPKKADATAAPKATKAKASAKK